MAPTSATSCTDYRSILRWAVALKCIIQSTEVFDLYSADVIMPLYGCGEHFSNNYCDNMRIIYV